MATVDWIVLAVVLFSAFAGWRNGLVASALSLAGLAAGAYLGSRIGPHVLNGGARSGWTPIAGLLGALFGAVLLQTAASIGAAFLRRGLRLTPLRLLDSAGGIFFGAATGLVLVWVVGAAALLVPGQTALRREAQRSAILRRLNDAESPQRLLHLLARVDPFPSITGPEAPTQPPSAAILRARAVHAAARSVVKIEGTACGVGVEGTGWFVTARLVVTAAHVVAGETDTAVSVPGREGLYRADAVAFDGRNDIAVLRVHGVTASRPLRQTTPRPSAAVVVIGYPQNGPLTLTPGRIGRTAGVLTGDAYGHGPIPRTVTALSGQVEHGDSGGPAVDVHGLVETTVFAARIASSSGGFGVPPAIVSRVLGSAQARPVSTGSCAG